jgi:hypothetical protein
MCQRDKETGVVVVESYIYHICASIYIYIYIYIYSTSVEVK